MWMVTFQNVSFLSRMQIIAAVMRMQVSTVVSGSCNLHHHSSNDAFNLWLVCVAVLPLRPCVYIQMFSSVRLSKHFFKTFKTQIPNTTVVYISSVILVTWILTYETKCLLVFTFINLV